MNDDLLNMELCATLDTWQGEGMVRKAPGHVADT